MTLLSDFNLLQLRKNIWGLWLSAKIYADSREKCACGGKFSAIGDYRGIKHPICDQCSEPPNKLRIRAKVVDPSTLVRYIDIRADKEGRLFDHITDCFSTLREVERSLRNNSFDSRVYENKKKRERFLFSNIQKDYVAHFEEEFKKGKITFYGLKGKKKNSKLLLPYFGKFNVDSIDKTEVQLYIGQFNGPPSNLKESVNEMKTILRWGHGKRIVSRLPSFDTLKSNKRTVLPDLQVTRDKIIPHIKNPIIKMAIKLIVDYGIRPCEARAIMGRNIVLSTNELIIDQHFSGSQLLPGRKSNPNGRYAMLRRKLTKSLREFYIESGIKDNEPLFRASQGGYLPENAISKEWTKTLKKLGIKHVQLYGLRHARGSEVINETDGNFMEAKEFLGHSDIKTTLGTYATYNLKHMDKYFNEEEMGEILPMIKKEIV